MIGGWSQPGAARLPAGTRLELEHGTAAGGGFLVGEAVRVGEAALAPRLRELGFRSALGAPIHVAGALWGALIASSDSGEPWTEDAEKRLADFAELVAQAVANADARELLADARHELGLALAELRELAHGLDPAVLSERGLEPALESLAERVPIPIEVTEVPAERLPEPVEVAAEALRTASALSPAG